jgi:hypothetical protein
MVRNLLPHFHYRPPEIHVFLPKGPIAPLIIARQVRNGLGATPESERPRSEERGIEIDIAEEALPGE